MQLDLTIRRKVAFRGLFSVLLVFDLTNHACSFTLPKQLISKIGFGNDYLILRRRIRHNRNELVVSRNLSNKEEFTHAFDDDAMGFYDNDDDPMTQIKRQQKQINFLMSVIQNHSPEKEETRSYSEKSLRNSAKIEEEDNLLPKPLQDISGSEKNENDRTGTPDTISLNSSLSNQTTPSTSLISRDQLPPLKTMLFIDGTWLYYNIFRRKPSECPVCFKYGVGWQYRYRFDWNALPRVICEQLVRQQETRVRSWMQYKPSSHFQ